MLKVKEITVKAVCLKNLDNKLAQQAVASAIDHSFNKSEKMQEFHKTNKFKNYSFTPLTPFPTKGIYEKGDMVIFKIRVVDKDLEEHFLKHLPALETEYFVLVTATIRIIPQYKIDTLNSLSPVILKTEVAYWRGNYDVEYFLDALNTNVIKKYNILTNSNIPLGTTIFEEVTFKKERVKRNYKNIVLIGDTCSIKVKDNKIAQDIAYMSIATGVCHMAPRGFSTVTHQYRKESLKC